MIDELATSPDPAPRRILGRLRGPARRLGLAVGWLVAVLLISFGAAGVVAGVGGPPGSAARPELTWRGDSAIRPGLAAATRDLQALATEVDALGTTARGALAAVIATDRTQLSAAVDDGTQKLERIQSDAVALRARLLALPGVGAADVNGLTPSSALTLGPDVSARFDALLAALDTTRGLPADWALFTTRSLAAEGLTTLLLDHDQQTANAAVQGRGGDYAGALRTLDGSDALIAQGRALRDQLSATTDTTTLTAWLDRNAAYDAALRILYAALETSKGIVTAPVRDAFAGEQAARQQLPPDTRGLVVILGDLARGGLNQAAISIETARGQLDTALAALVGATTPGD